MSEWRVYRLGELVENHNSLRRPVKASERIRGEVPYYGASGIVDWVDGFTHEGCFLLISEDGENLRSRSTPIAFGVSGRCWINNHAHVVSGRESFDTRFLEYALARVDIAGYLTGSAQPKLSRAAMESIKLFLPPANWRRAVAETLNALDEKIAANVRIIQQGFDLSSALLSIRAETAPPVRLRDVVASMTRGVAPAYVEIGGLIVVNQKCVRNQSVDLSLARMSGRLPSADRLLTRDDVLVNSTGYGTLGRVARWTRQDLAATVDSHVTIVRFDEASVDPVCAGTALVRMADNIERLAEGSTGQTELRRELLGGLRMQLPTLEIQRALRRQLRVVDDLEFSRRAENERLVATRDGLLPLLMSGKVRVKDAEKVVEEVL